MTSAATISAPPPLVAPGDVAVATLADLASRALAPRRPRLAAALAVALPGLTAARAAALLADAGVDRVNSKGVRWRPVWREEGEDEDDDDGPREPWWLRWRHRRPRELWEAFVAAGALPADWVGSDDAGAPPPARVFEAEARVRTNTLHAPTGGWRAAHPASLVDALALGCDPEGMLTAEALVREGLARAARVRGAGWRPPAGVAWRALREWYAWPGRAPSPASAPVGDPAPAILAWRARAEDHLRAFAAARGGDAAPRDLAVDLARHLAWREEPGLAALPDPFAPLVALWATGYACASLDDGAGHVVLLCPAVPRARPGTWGVP